MLPVGPFGFEDFDLTIGRVEKFCDVIAVRISVDLNPERNALFPAVLLRRELRGEAVHWRVKTILRRSN